jgi:DNA-binding transcriptional LysR family regulator
VTLTPAGEDYHLQAVRILADVEEANRSIAERGGQPRGLLRVSLPVAFARLHVAPIVADFLRAYPEIELELVMTDQIVNLVEDRIDVAIRLGSLDSSSLVARRLAPHRRIVCATPDYLAEYGEPRVPGDLARHNCLTFSYASGDRIWRFERAGKTEQVRVRGSVRANNSETLREVALQGLGLLFMPTWLIGEDISAGRFRAVLPEWTPQVGKEASISPMPASMRYFSPITANRRNCVPSSTSWKRVSVRLPIGIVTCPPDRRLPELGPQGDHRCAIRNDDRRHQGIIEIRGPAHIAFH